MPTPRCSTPPPDSRGSNFISLPVHRRTLFGWRFFAALFVAFVGLAGFLIVLAATLFGN